MCVCVCVCVCVRERERERERVREREREGERERERERERGREGGREGKGENAGTVMERQRGVSKWQILTRQMSLHHLSRHWEMYILKKKSKQLRFREETQTDLQSAPSWAHPSPATTVPSPSPGPCLRPAG